MQTKDYKRYSDKEGAFQRYEHVTGIFITQGDRYFVQRGDAGVDCGDKNNGGYKPSAMLAP